MMNLQKSLWTWVLMAVLITPISQLSAQNKKNKDKVSDTLHTELTEASQDISMIDSLQHIIDSLQSSLIQAGKDKEHTHLLLQQLQAENDSLKSIPACDMSYVLNYGNALLYRKYSARADDIAALLTNIPENLKQKDRDQMLAEAKVMVQSSEVSSQDIRNRVYHLLEMVPHDQQANEDIREILSHVPQDKVTEYSLTKHAIELIDQLPREVTAKDDRYTIIRNLLLAYKDATVELKAVLQSIQDHPGNSIDMPDNKSSFIKQIKTTNYYKQYYDQVWTIPYLNSVINTAIARLQNATSHIDMEDLIKEL